MNGKLHPQAAELLAGIFKPPATPVAPTAAGMRAISETVTEALVGPGEPVARVWDASIDFHGTSIPVRWYVPYDEEPSLLTVYVHGGGWVTGTLDSYDTLCRSLALRSSSIVLNVAYSLSPEVQHPTALNEVCFVLEQARTLAQSFGYAPSQIALAGDSSGGHLIAAALHRRAAEDAVPLDKAVFLYPVTDAATSHPSWRTMGTGYNLTAARMRWYWEQYAGPDWVAHAASPELSPLRSPHLAKFPPSMVVTAEFDPLLDEGNEFAQRLSQSGVKVEHLVVPGQLHGFLRFRKALTDPVWGTDAVIDRIGNFLRSS